MIPRSSTEWPIPILPKALPVIITPISEAIIEEDGFYLSKTNAYHLENNVVEMKAYIKKLELLNKNIINYYK